MRTLIRRLAGVALGLGMLGGMVVASAPPAEAATACANQLFSYSLTTKTCVTYIQTMVNDLYAYDSQHFGYLGAKRVLVVDGKYGDKTVSAVSNIEKHLYLYKSDGIKILATVHGKTGEQLWTHLCGFSEGKSVFTKAGCGSLVTSYVASGLEQQAHS